MEQPLLRLRQLAILLKKSRKNQRKNNDTTTNLEG